jgi:hypothetical protein
MRAYDRFHPFQREPLKNPHVGFVRQVYGVTFSTGKRFEIVLTGGWTVYTWDALKASLCERAAVLHRAVELGIRKTDYGYEISDAALVPEPQELIA